MTRLPRWHRACVGGMGGTAAAGGMGGTAAEQVVYRVENVGLFVVPSDGSTPAQRVSQPLIAGGAVLSDFAISPDGTRVVYQADADTDDVVELYAVNPDGTDFQKLNAPLPVGQVVSDFVVAR
ncbi:MAG: LpqB family beta-propeller domain-containing protein [Polyangiales bacterium]